MRMSDLVTQYILELLESSGGSAEIQRNELAGELGCVPSQINYVITSRFTPEQGYLVESRRGGGGYIRIMRMKLDRSSALMHLINSIGSRLDAATAAAMLRNLEQQSILSAETARLMSAALSDRSYRDIPPELRDFVRASIFKNMLLVQLTAQQGT